MNRLKIKTRLFCIYAIAVSACGSGAEPAAEKPFTLQWQDTLAGDFTFAKSWIYPYGVYPNDFGQLSCDGFCPPGTDAMKDSAGRIYPDSLARFYSLVDTTHQYLTMMCEAWCYEWAGTDFIDVQQYGNDSTVCHTRANGATHCYLHLCITDTACRARIVLHSIVPGGNKIFYRSSGNIRVDKKRYDNDTLRAIFDFRFKNTVDPDKEIYWKGRIMAPVKKAG